MVLAAGAATPVDTLAASRSPGRTWSRWPAADLERRLARADVPELTDDFAPVDRLMALVLLRAER